MDNSPEAISDIVLGIHLASALPTGLDGHNDMLASASVCSLLSRTKYMKPKLLRNFEYSIKPLLMLLSKDLDSPLTIKTAACLRSLMFSRICMADFLKNDGLLIIAQIFDTIFKDTDNLTLSSMQHELLQHLAACYRDIGRIFPWNIVKVGALRHCVLLLRFGDVFLKTIAAGVTLTLASLPAIIYCNQYNIIGIMASLSTDFEICKQLFINGAITPLLLASDKNITNEACTLASLGIVNTLSYTLTSHE
jgi:hypothetical protein